MVEASLEFDLCPGALKFQKFHWCRIYKLGLWLNLSSQKMYRNLT